MPKKVRMKTFTNDSPIVTSQHDEFGLDKDIGDSFALRRVLVRVIPLNWVYNNGG